MGTEASSDQRTAMKFFRTGTASVIGPYEWQRQGFDHVLREKERAKGAFEAVAYYILANPLRKNLVTQWEDYPHSGAMVPGYPSLNPRTADFWETYWKVFSAMAE